MHGLISSVVLCLPEPLETTIWMPSHTGNLILDRRQTVANDCLTAKGWWYLIVGTYYKRPTMQFKKNLNLIFIGRCYPIILQVIRELLLNIYLIGNSSFCFRDLN